MKPSAFLLPVIVAFCFLPFCCGAEPVKLEVHEWGTFTCLMGSDEAPVSWYLGDENVAELPAFVGTPIGSGKRISLLVGLTLAGKGFRPAPVRMETPVMYFYPSAAMAVKATVRFREGSITETFRAPQLSSISGTRMWSSGRVSWQDRKMDRARL